MHSRPDQLTAEARDFENFILTLRLCVTDKPYKNPFVVLFPRAEHYNDSPVMLDFSSFDQDIKNDLIEAIADQVKRQQTRHLTTAAGIRAEQQQRARQNTQDESQQASRAAYIQKAIDLSQAD